MPRSKSLPPPRRRPLGRLVLLGPLAPLLAACQEPPPIPETPHRPIAWMAVGAAETVSHRALSGVVRPVQRAPLAFEVGGRVETLEVDVGDHFKRGDVLGRLDQRTYRLAREERASEVVQAKAVVHEAEQEHTRQQRLNAEGWASEAAFDTAQAALDTARGRLATARARLDIAEEHLADTVLLAPYAGMVARRHAEPAQQVTAAETVLEIQGNGGGFEIAVAVPETLVDGLRPGDIHTVTFPARPGATVQARVTEVSTEAGRGGTFPVTLRLATPHPELRAGMTAEVTITLAVAGAPATDGKRDADPPVSVPVTAFLAGAGADTVAFVFKPADDAGLTGVLERRTITLGAVDSERAMVTAGLTPGEVIATRGLPFLRAGQIVSRLGVGPQRYE